MQQGKERLLNKWYYSKMVNICKTWTSTPTHFTKINLRCIIDLNIKAETINFKKKRLYGLWLLAFGFWLGRGKGATIFGHPESRFIQHQLPPPCPLSSTPMRSKLCTWGALVAKLVPPESALALKIGPLGLSPKMLVMTSPKWPVIGRV